ncbi:MAG: HAD family hydrolase [Verrucomicrobiia bacterium]
MKRDWAAIFDWDGVIVDSSEPHEQAWEILAKREGRTCPPGFFPKSFGMKNERVIPELLKWSNDPQEIHRLSIEKEAVYREIIRKQGIKTIPGALQWLKQLKDNGIARAIASSTIRENIDCALEILGLGKYFQAIVAGEDVRQGKPEPEVFLLAARRLGREPKDCVVFEDAHVGIEAGLRAGMKVVALATTHPDHTLKGAHLVVKDFTKLDLQDVDALF